MLADCGLLAPDVLDSVAFSPVKSDLSGNIKVRWQLPNCPSTVLIPLCQKLRERQLAAPAESENIQDLCRNELKTKKHTATEGLLWLVRFVPPPFRYTFAPRTDASSAGDRGLEFTCAGLSSNIAKPSEELADSFRGAYGNTLKPHHNFLVKPIFSAAMSACPYRKDFYAKLGDSEEKVQTDLGAYLAALDKIVGILKGFLDTKDAKW